jgi:hypothetical protein
MSRLAGGTSNDTELETLKKRLRLIMYRIDCPSHIALGASRGRGKADGNQTRGFQMQFNQTDLLLLIMKPL